MRKIFLFMMVSSDGYFEGPDHDISWHNASNEEFQRLVEEHAVQSDAILMGRKTCELMAGYWPTQHALKEDPDTAQFMNNTPKYIVSHKPFTPDWTNVTVFHKDVMKKIRDLKNQPGKDISLFGSNELCVSMMPEGLVDEFRIMVNPIALGAGTSLFTGLKKPVPLKLMGVRQYTSGNVLLTYR